jgi:2',3'-cyclic-nucleotide 2'-phosphodiesterase (5'-nucleotidase family)
MPPPWLLVHTCCRLDNFLALSQQCTFPWLMSNVDEKVTGEPLAGGRRSLLLEWQGVRVGLLGE